MRKLRTIIILILFILLSGPIMGQNLSIIGREHPLYQLENRLILGDKNALIEIAPYFSSKVKVNEFLGHHLLATDEATIAKRIVSENCLFTSGEFTFSDSLGNNLFMEFLLRNWDRIEFSQLATSFILTPIEIRPINYKIRALSDKRKQELKEDAKSLLKSKWVVDNKIDSLVRLRNPAALLLTASELFKQRYRYNRYRFDGIEFINLLQYLTGVEIGVENENNDITWFIDKEFYPDARLNLLIFFSKFYQQFTWDEEQMVFVNPGLEVEIAGKEELLFQLLNDPNDSIAIDAFTQLSLSDPDKVSKLADQYRTSRMDHSYALPTFPYKFLKQLVKLTSYCKENQIDFTGTDALRKNILLLNTDLTFSQRRVAEDKLVAELALTEIAALEYWALIHGGSWQMTYSAGRILDKFYSKHFAELLSNENHLKHYLKKSFLFNNLGIIGVCNNYLLKFTDQQSVGIQKLEAITTDDSDISKEILKAKTYCNVKVPQPEDPMKINDSNRDYDIRDLTSKIKSLNRIKDEETRENSLTELLAQINYQQIREALAAIENIPFTKNEWKKYSFLERDFGFFAYNNFDEKATRAAFIKDYHSFDEMGFYKNMLTQMGVDYTNTDHSLDYDKIFDILKYNIVVAFVGGGGGRQDNEAYAIIKVLELTFDTTLGYPKKLCNSEGMYACDSQDRANYWMQYLKEKKLLQREHNEAVSFHYK